MAVSAWSKPTKERCDSQHQGLFSACSMSRWTLINSFSVSYLSLLNHICNSFIDFISPTFCLVLLTSEQSEWSFILNVYGGNIWHILTRTESNRPGVEGMGSRWKAPRTLAPRWKAPGLNPKRATQRRRPSWHICVFFRTNGDTLVFGIDRFASK